MPQRIEQLLERAARYREHKAATAPLLSPAEGLVARAARYKQEKARRLAQVELPEDFKSTFDTGSTIDRQEPIGLPDATRTGGTPAPTPEALREFETQPDPHPFTPIADASKKVLQNSPKWVQLGYERSLHSLAQELVTGDKWVDLSDYEPNVIEDISATVLSFVMPLDAITLVAGGGAGGLVTKTVAKKLAQKLITMGVKKTVATKAVQVAVAGVRSGAALGTYGGTRPALEGRPEDIPEEFGKNFALGFILGTVGQGIGAPMRAWGKGGTGLANRARQAAGQTGALATEIGALAEGGALVEGEWHPKSWDEVIHAAGVVLGLKIVHGASEKAKKVVAERFMEQSVKENRPVGEIITEIMRDDAAWEYFFHELPTKVRTELEKVRLDEYRPGESVKLEPGKSDTELTQAPEQVATERAGKPERGTKARVSSREQRLDRNYRGDRDEFDLKISMEREQNPDVLPKELRPKSGNMAVSDIKRYVEEAFNVPIRRGLYRRTTPKGKRTGIYKIKPEVVRLDKIKDLPSMSHEVAHHLDKTHTLESLYKGMEEIGRLDYDIDRVMKGKPDHSEGFAEYMRHWLTRESDVSVIAPEFTAKFEKFLDADPVLKARLENLRAMIGEYAKQGAEARVKAAMVIEDVKDRKSLGFHYRRFQTAFTDALTPLKVVSEEIERRRGQKLRGSEDAYQMATALKHKSTAKAQNFLTIGTADFDGKITGKPLMEALAPIPHERMEDAMYYAYAKHAVERWAQSKNPGVGLADAEFFIETHKSAEFDKFAKELTAYRTRLLDYVIDAGGLSQETAAIWREMYEYSLPLYRAGFEKGGAGGGRGYGGLPQPVKRAKGSERQVVNPYAGLVQETARLISWADRARVGKTLVESIERTEGMGSVLEKVDVPALPVKIQTERIIELLKKKGLDVDYSPEMIDEVMTFYTHEAHGLPKENVVTFWKDGKLAAYKLEPELYRAITDMDYRQLSGWFNVLTAPKKVLVAGATGYRASFGLVTNAVRDPFTYAMQSDAKWAHPFQVVKGDWEAAKKKTGLGTPSEEARLWFQQGGEMVTFFNSELPQAMNKTKRMMADAKWDQRGRAVGGKVGGKTLVTFKHPIDLYRDIINLPEMGPRITEFKHVYAKVMKETGNHRDAWIEAFNASQDVTLNFSRSGHWGSQLNQIIPFLNPAIQDASIFVRRFKKEPWLTAGRGVAGLTGPTLALWYLNKDEDWYQALPTWRKISYWHFKVPGIDEIWAIPKPFSWGWAFSAVPEGVVDAAYRENPEIAKEAIIEGFMNQVPAIMPAFAGPTLEAWANYSFFQDRNIDPHWETQKLPASKRASRFTSKSAQGLANWLAVNTGIEVSPRRIDYWLQAQTGGMGRDIIQGIEGATGQRPKRETLADTPFIGRLVARDPFIGHFYEQRRKNQEKKNKIDLKPEDQLSDEDLRVLGLWKRYEDYAKDLSDIRKTIIGYSGDMNLPFKKRQEVVEKLAIWREHIAHGAIFDDYEIPKAPQFDLEAYRK